MATVGHFRNALRQGVSAWLKCLTALAMLGGAGLPPAWGALYAEYHLEETSYNGTAGEVKDTSGNGRHAQIVGAATSSATGRAGRGLLIPENTTSTIAALDTGIDINSIGNAGTISFWYKSTASSDGWKVLYDASTSTAARFYFVREGDAGTDGTTAVITAGTSQRNVYDANGIDDTQWSHVTVTWNGATMRAYVLNADCSTRWDESNTAAGVIHADTGTLYFGDNRSTAITGGYHDSLDSANGSFDLIRIYNHAQTPTEVSANCANTASLHHMEVTTTSASAMTGTAVTYTIKACANAACSSLYTAGVSGTLSVIGTGVTTTYNTGAAFSIGSGSSSTTESVTLTKADGGTAAVSLTGLSPAAAATPDVYCGLGVAASSGNSCNFTITPAVHHLELTASSNTALTCQPITYTVKACSNADCSSTYTGGLTGTLSVTGVTVNYPSGSGFTIANGSATTTITAHATTTGTATAGLTGLSITPSNSPSVFCGMGSAAGSGASCGITMTDAGLFFDVPDHHAEASQTVTVSAVRKSDNSLMCTPAFASVNKNVTFKCSYSNPTSGYVPVRVGGAALNAGNNASAVCDGTGRSVSLTFDASGVATTTVQYADAGQMGMTAIYTGSGSDAGLSMTGSDTFVAVPHDFGVSSSAGGNIVAGQSFGVTVQARNASGTATRNFGRETSPATAALAFLRTRPTLSGAVDGSQSTSLGAWSNGQASGTVRYDEVGRGDVAAALSGGSYLGSGKAPAGSTAGSWVSCASENGSCVLPSGAQATVIYGANGRFNHLTGRTGTVSCSNATFSDPIVGTAKQCYYVATGGSNTAVNGAVGPFIPAYFNVGVTQACAGGTTPFTYSGQPFSMTVTALNALGGRTYNYDGTANTSPNYAKAVTLSAATNASLGALGTTSLPASTFAAGVASLSTQSFTFTNKLTAPAAVSLRAVDEDSVSSAGHDEAAASLRSGRLRLFNKFGSEKAALAVPVQAQHWSGQAWLINSDDTACTNVSTASVVRARYLDNKGAVTTGWSSSASGGGTLLNGQGTVTMSAPTGGATGTVELAINLGTTTTDVSCLSAHPASTGMGHVWLRGLNGSCATTHDRDPSARATFGVHAPETSRTIHVHEHH